MDYIDLLECISASVQLLFPTAHRLTFQLSVGKSKLRKRKLNKGEYGDQPKLGGKKFTLC